MIKKQYDLIAYYGTEIRMQRGQNQTKRFTLLY